MCELRTRYIAVSSAKSLTLDLTCSVGHWCKQEKGLDRELCPGTGSLPSTIAPPDHPNVSSEDVGGPGHCDVLKNAICFYHF